MSTCQVFCSSANSREAGRRQRPERAAAGTACTTGPAGHQRGGPPCLLALPLYIRWLTLPGGTRNGMRLTGNASAVRPGQTHLPSTHPPLCTGQEWEEAPQTETASQNHQQLPCLIPSGLCHPHPCNGVRAVTPGPWMLNLVLCAGLSQVTYSPV